MHPQLTLCTFVPSESLLKSLSKFLSSERFVVHTTDSEPEFFALVEEHRQYLDCLIFQDNDSLPPMINHLYEQGILLPVVIFIKESEALTTSVNTSYQSDEANITNGALPANFKYLFHSAEVQVGTSQLPEIINLIDQAIARFLYLSPHCSLPHKFVSVDGSTEVTQRNFLMHQQRRLSEKLQERLGYLGVYYKRNPQLFLRHLPPAEQRKFLENLKLEYCHILLKYFSGDPNLNQKIDRLVEQAFFADISISRIVEIHMELIDEFSKQLKLEGRNESILLDYRLTLIDFIAHLGEMYRRSIPREL
ncbi:MAG: circadian clock protein KaiA [Symploca sp. SIO2G7]|nr:circadian clock protein KaiA [Symploca sp. SIO2G7]